MRPLNVVFAFALLFFACTVHAQVCTGDFTFLTQADVDQFLVDNPTCTSIEGNVYVINDENAGDWITDLSGFQNITQITGNLSVTVYYPTMTMPAMSFVGLSNLNTITGDVFLEDYVGVIGSLAGFENLYTIGGLNVTACPGIVDWSPLDNLSYCQGMIFHNATTGHFVNSFPGISELPLGFFFYQTDAVPFTPEDFSVLNNMINCGGIFFSNENSGSQVSGIVNFNSFQNLLVCTSIYFDLFFCTNFNAFQNLHTVDNASLFVLAENYSALSSLTSANYLAVTDMVGSQNYPAFPVLASAGSMDVLGTAQLPSFPVLTSVSGNLNMQSTLGMSVPQLTNVGGSLTIANCNLANLNFLDNLQTVGGSINITTNPNLTDCSAQVVCDRVASDPTNVTLLDNAAGCNTTSEIAASCSVTVDTEAPMIECGMDIFQNSDLGTCQAAITLSSVLAFDNVGIASITNSFNAGGPNASGVFPVGTTVITYTATDLSGNVSTCEATVTVVDFESPTVACAGETFVYVDAGGATATLTNISAPLVTDNCGISSVVNDHPSTTYNIGTNYVNWYVTDIHGNTVSCTQSITVLDQCDGDFTFTTQSEVDQFIIDHPNCTSITGSVYIINDESQGDWISDLLAFQNITSIGGDLNISQAGNSSLPPMDFYGLGSLHSVGGQIQIDDLFSGTITSLVGLENLTTCGSLYIAQCPALTNISGLSGLATTGNITFMACDNVQFSNAFPMLQSVTNDIQIFYSADASSQAEFSGFGLLLNVGGTIAISNSIGLPVTIDSFNAFHVLNSAQSISLLGFECDQFSGFENLVTCSSITFDVYANQYSDFYSLLSASHILLTSPTTPFSYTSFPALSSVHSLNVIVDGGNPVSFPVLSQLNDLQVQNTFGIDAPMLTTIDDSLEISNSTMTDLIWLENVVSVGGDITIFNNANLSSCSVEAVCQHISTDPGSVYVSGNLAGCNSVGEIAAGCQISYASGVIYADADCNGSFDNADARMSHHVILNEQNVPIGSSDAFGYYMATIPNNFSVTYQPSGIVGFVTPAAYSASNFGVFVTYPNNDFPFCPIPDFHNVSVSHVVQGSARPGDIIPVQVVVKNWNAFIESGTVSLDFTNMPGALVGTIDGGTMNGSAITWNYSGLGLFETAVFNVMFEVGAFAFIGDTYGLTSSATINGFTDLDPSTNSYSSVGNVVASYDPNEKAVNRPFINYDEVSTTEQIPLVYTIHFQNTGTAEALTVRLEDTFEENLDMSTIEMLSASHDYALTFDDNRKAIWTFENIHLADSATNLEGSIGYVQFRINAVAGLQLTDIVQNNASIFFDFNEAVETDYASTEFYTCPSDIQIFGDTVVCEYSNAIFNASEGWTSLMWIADGLPAGSAPNFAFWQVPSGVYQVVLEASTPNCSSSDAISLLVNPQPSTPVVTQTGNVLSVNTTNPCEWLYEGNVLPETGNSITITNSGNYTVSQIVNGCYSTGVSGFYIVTDVAEMAHAAVLTISPNPTKGETFFNFNTPVDGNSRMIIRDAIGREIANVSIISDQAIVDFTRFAPGIYAITILRNGELQGDVMRVVVE